MIGIAALAAITVPFQRATPVEPAPVPALTVATVATTTTTPTLTPTLTPTVMPTVIPTAIIVELPTPTATPTPTSVPAILGTGGYRQDDGPPPLWLAELMRIHAPPEWDEWELSAWGELLDRESSYDPNAQNPTSTAYGLGQFLNSTWDDVACVKTPDPSEQIRCMALYIVARYGTPGAALSFHDTHNYY